MKMFEWSAYGSIIVGLLSDLSAEPTTGVKFFIILVALIFRQLIWAAARRDQGWAAWVYFVLLAIAMFFNIGEFWAGGPSWLRELLTPETTSTALQRTLDVVWMLLAIVAFYFYVAARKPVARA
jgi:hypothetical protein